MRFYVIFVGGGNDGELLLAVMRLKSGRRLLKARQAGKDRACGGRRGGSGYMARMLIIPQQGARVKSRERWWD